jgi:hypothetical protein
VLLTAPGGTVSRRIGETGVVTTGVPLTVVTSQSEADVIYSFLLLRTESIKCADRMADGTANSADDSGDDDDSEPLLRFANQVLGDRAARVDRPVGFSGGAEQCDPEERTGRIVPQPVADACEAFAGQCLRPASAELVVVARTDLERDSEPSRLFDRAVGETQPPRRTELRQRAVCHGRGVHDARVAERFDECAERFFREIAGTPSRLEIEAAASVGVEPPRVQPAAMNPRQTSTRTQVEDREAGQVARLSQRAQRASGAALRRAASISGRSALRSRSHSAGVSPSSTVCGSQNHEAAVYGSTLASLKCPIAGGTAE